MKSLSQNFLNQVRRTRARDMQMFPVWPVPVQEDHKCRRRARAAYTTDCDTVSYFIQNSLLEQNPPDAAIPCIDALGKLLATNKHKTVNGFLSVPKRFFEKHIGTRDYALVMEWLEEVGIVIRSSSYSTGIDGIAPFAKAIKITDEAVSSGFSEVKLKAKKRAPKSTPHDSNIRYQETRSDIGMSQGCLAENERIFNQAILEASSFTNMIERQDGIVTAHRNRANFRKSIDEVRSGTWMTTKCRGGREYTPFTSLPASIRPYVTVDGEHTVELDGRSFHPAILCSIARRFARESVEDIEQAHAKWDSIPTKEGAAARKIVPDHEYSGSKSEVPESVSVAERRGRAQATKASVQNGREEIEEFTRLVLNGLLYDAVRKTARVPESRLKDVKTLVLKFLNEKPSAAYGDDFERHVRKTFQEMFPAINEVARQIKKETHVAMSAALTLKESEIFSHPILDELGALRVHDAIYVKESLAEKAETLLTYAMHHAGVQATVSVEKTKRLFTEDVEPVSEWRFEGGWVRGNQTEASLGYEQFLSGKENPSPEPCSRPGSIRQRYPHTNTPSSLPLPLSAAKLAKIDSCEPKQFRTEGVKRGSRPSRPELLVPKTRPPP